MYSVIITSQQYVEILRSTVLRYRYLPYNTLVIFISNNSYFYIEISLIEILLPLKIFVLYF